MLLPATGDAPRPVRYLRRLVSITSSGEQEPSHIHRLLDALLTERMTPVLEVVEKTDQFDLPASAVDEMREAIDKLSSADVAGLVASIPLAQHTQEMLKTIAYERARQQLIQLPVFLRGRGTLLGAEIGIDRLFVIGLCLAITLALQLALTRTRFGARLRASVDDARVARGLGIDVGRVFALTFAVGTGLAGLAGALSVDLLGVDPTFPIFWIKPLM